MPVLCQFKGPAVSPGTLLRRALNVNKRGAGAGLQACTLLFAVQRALAASKVPSAAEAARQHRLNAAL